MEKPSRSPRFFVSEVPEETLCPICFHVMLQPRAVLADCLHEFCSGCLSESATRAATARSCTEAPAQTLCPLDRLAFERTAPARRTQAIVGRLITRCDYVDGGCDWVGPVSDLQDHLLSEHATCDPLPLPDLPAIQFCPHCSEGVVDMEAHLKACPRQWVPCPLDCRTKDKAIRPRNEATLALPTTVMPRVGVRKHMRDECPMRVVPCPYAKYGCSALCIKKCSVVDHEGENMAAHMAMAVKFAGAMGNPLKSAARAHTYGLRECPIPTVEEAIGSPCGVLWPVWHRPMRRPLQYEEVVGRSADAGLKDPGLSIHAPPAHPSDSFSIFRWRVPLVTIAALGRRGSARSKQFAVGGQPWEIELSRPQLDGPLIVRLHTNVPAHGHCYLSWVAQASPLPEREPPADLSNFPEPQKPIDDQTLCAMGSRGAELQGLREAAMELPPTPKPSSHADPSDASQDFREATAAFAERVIDSSLYRSAHVDWIQDADRSGDPKAGASCHPWEVDLGRPFVCPRAVFGDTVVLEVGIELPSPSCILWRCPQEISPVPQPVLWPLPAPSAPSPPAPAPAPASISQPPQPPASAPMTGAYQEEALHLKVRRVHPAVRPASSQNTEPPVADEQQDEQRPWGDTDTNSSSCSTSLDLSHNMSVMDHLIRSGYRLTPRACLPPSTPSPRPLSERHSSTPLRYPLNLSVPATPLDEPSRASSSPTTHSFIGRSSSTSSLILVPSPGELRKGGWMEDNASDESSVKSTRTLPCISALSSPTWIPRPTRLQCGRSFSTPHL